MNQPMKFKDGEIVICEDASGVPWLVEGGTYTVKNHRNYTVQRGWLITMDGAHSEITAYEDRFRSLATVQPLPDNTRTVVVHAWVDINEDMGNREMVLQLKGDSFSYGYIINQLLYNDRVHVENIVDANTGEVIYPAELRI